MNKILKKTYWACGDPTLFMLEIEVILRGRAILIVNRAFNAGSSQHGKARRASVAWN